MNDYVEFRNFRTNSFKFNVKLTFIMTMRQEVIPRLENHFPFLRLEHLPPSISRSCVVSSCRT